MPLSSPSDRTGRGQTARTWFGALAIVALVAAIYAPVVHGSWLWDDRVDILENPQVRDPAGWWKIWLRPEGWHFFPLKSTVEWLQWQWWGEATTGYHVTNIMLHAAAALLLWRLLWKLRLPFAWLAAAVFAVHPIAVESVAWIAELKNVLSLPLLLLAALAWLEWDERPRPASYALALGGFAAAALAKSAVVMFPMVLLLHAWWKRGALRQPDLRAAAPFFAVALAIGLLTVHFEHRAAHALVDWPQLSLTMRFAVAGQAAVFYVGQLFWPARLSPVYPAWNPAALSVMAFWPWLVIALFLTLAWRFRAGWGRAALFGLGFYLLNLFPVSGVIPMAYAHISWVADHFAYLPAIGLIALGCGAAGAAAQADRGRSRMLATVTLAAATLLLLARASRDYAKVFTSEERLWRHAVATEPDAWLPHHNLAMLLTASGRTAEAVPHYEAALRAQPANAEAWNNLGNARLRAGATATAIEAYRAAVKWKPGYAEAWANLANALAQARDQTGARRAADQALALTPTHAMAHRTLGELAAAEGRSAEALEHFDAALRAAPDQPDLLNAAGVALMQLQRPAEARTRFEAALRLAPAEAEARVNLGYAWLELGDEGRAVSTWRDAAEHARSPLAHAALGTYFLRREQLEAAAREFEAVLSAQPDNVDAHNNLAVILARRGRFREALPHAEAAARAAPTDAGIQRNLEQLRRLVGDAAR